eukprot:TRINITY_DN1474_c0_g1_i2.p1 TRINITY_DN1474_c0_g1~~TRINITY_DN1474_c0_g1_i2.p1  ORF type:complete len:490 (+),score=142.29 TRINITY_DN1474_c0_g1_i2:171-1472(+)
MLRSLVGSEMCIRDRYQRRVRGLGSFLPMARKDKIKELEALKIKHASADRYQQVEQVQRQIDALLNGEEEDDELPVVKSPPEPDPPKYKNSTPPGNMVVAFKSDLERDLRRADSRDQEAVCAQTALEIEKHLQNDMELPASALRPLKVCHQFEVDLGPPKRSDPDNVTLLLNSLSPEHCTALQLRVKSFMSLPEAVGRLSELTVLNLSDCSNLKALPSEMSHLHKLVVLNLYFCIGLAQLPEAVGNCRSLTEITMTSCTSLLKLPDLLGSLASLTTLNLAFCSRLPALPASLGQLGSLRSLDLSYCWSLGELPVNIGGLKALEVLNLSNCAELAELPASVGQLKALQQLNCSGCTALAELPDTVSGLTALVDLDLSFCSSLSTIPECIGDLEQLESLNLYLCDALQTLPDFLNGPITEQKKLKVVGRQYLWQN